MSKLPSLKSLIPERYESIPKGLIESINSFFRSVYDALNQNLTIAENFNGDIKTFIYDGSEIKIPWTRSEKPTFAVIGAISRVDGAALDITVAPFVKWSYTQENQIKIESVLGVTASTKYNISVLFLVK